MFEEEPLELNPSKIVKTSLTVVAPVRSSVPLTIALPDNIRDPVRDEEPVIETEEPCKVKGTLLAGLPTTNELVDISNKETSDTLWITLPGTLDFICTNVDGSPACTCCFELVVLILLPAFTARNSALVKVIPPISSWLVFKLLPALRSSTSCLEKEVPPILIVFASTSTVEAVIYWKTPDTALILPEAVKWPDTVSIVTILVLELEPL